VASSRFFFCPATVFRELTGWPAHGASTEYVQVNVRNGLARIRPGIDNRPVASAQLTFPSDLGGDSLQSTKYGFVFGGRMIKRRHMFSRADEDVRGRLWTDVFKGKYVRIFVNNF
jgi:hypothetical protein